ncbi:MAG: hypothetical protein PHP00_10530 [Thiotrichaceae bacterium]|nr:hypothetical protein [Thiotrichaceae bacterium]
MKLLSTLVMAAFLAGNVAPAFAAEAAPKTEKPAKAKKAHKAKADAKVEKPAAKPATK